MFQGNIADAEKELREAQRLDPDGAETLVRLGECAKERGKLDDAIALWNEAKQIDPTDAGVRAHLGDAYAKKRDREKAVRELKEAERLDPEDVNSEQIVWQGYAALHETPLALEHLEKFVALARKEGLAPKMVDYMEACGRELKARLTPNEITADLPTIYTRQSLDAALRERLTPAEYKLVINPLSSTPAMDRWAQELTRGATNDLDRARKIFDALTRHLDTGETQHTNRPGSVRGLERSGAIFLLPGICQALHRAGAGGGLEGLLRPPGERLFRRHRLSRLRCGVCR